MSTVQKVEVDEKLWWPETKVFWENADFIKANGLPCRINVKLDLASWGRVTLVLTPLEGSFQQLQELAAVE
jgi:hypothetical protein